MSESTCSLPSGRSLTLEGAAAKFLDAIALRGLSAATRESRGNALRQFGKFWRGRDLREATPGDLEAYSRGVQTRVSRETAYLYLAGVRELFRFLIQAQELLVDPSSHLPMPRMHHRLAGKILGRAEVARLIESPDPSRPTGLRDRALLEFLYSTGLRAGEARRVAVADLGEEAVSVRHGKGARDRVVPVGARAMAWVRRYVAEVRPGADALFLTHHGRPFGELSFQQQMRKLGAKAGIDHLTCHVIRRTMATHLLAAGASPQEVSAILGHSDLKSLSKYVKVAAREAKETHARSHPRER